MKLYFSKGACSLSVRIILNEIGVNAEYEAVDLRTKKTASGKDYLTINSKGPVPALITDNNECLTENIAIHQYIADTYKATQLLPALGDFTRYRVIEFSSFISSDVHKSFSALFNKDISQEDKNNIFFPMLKRRFDYLNQHLQQKNYLVGEHFTIADAYLFVVTTWLERIHIDINQWPAVASYFAKLKMRKSIQQSLEEEK